MPPKKKNPTDSISIIPEKPKAKPRPKSRKKSGGNALYILLIMFLLCIIAVMGVNYFHKGSSVEEPKKQNVVKSKDQLPSTESSGNEQKNSDEVKKDPQVDEQKKIRVYFIDLDPKTEKLIYRPVERTVSSKDSLRQSLEHLAKGLNSDEKNRGYLSGIPTTLKILSIAQNGDIARIDLSEDFLKNAYGDIATGRLNQIFLTATQFPGVKGIEILVRGKKVKSIGGDGLVIHWPMRKKL